MSPPHALFCNANTTELFKIAKKSTEVKIRHPLEASITFRLHHQVTVFILAFCVILSTFYSFFDVSDSAIQCYYDRGLSLPDELVNRYCWMMSTFTLSKYLHHQSEEISIGPGVGPFTEKDEKLYHAYYQWVPLFLFFQCACFYAPHALWKYLEGGKFKKMIASLKLVQKPNKKGKPAPANKNTNRRPCIDFAIETLLMIDLPGIHVLKRVLYEIALSDTELTKNQLAKTTKYRTDLAKRAMRYITSINRDLPRRWSCALDIITLALLDWSKRQNHLPWTRDQVGLGGWIKNLLQDVTNQPLEPMVDKLCKLPPEHRLCVMERYLCNSMGVNLRLEVKCAIDQGFSPIVIKYLVERIGHIDLRILMEYIEDWPKYIAQCCQDKPSCMYGWPECLERCPEYFAKCFKDKPKCVDGWSKCMERCPEYFVKYLKDKPKCVDLWSECMERCPEYLAKYFKGKPKCVDGWSECMEGWPEYIAKYYKDKLKCIKEGTDCIEDWPECIENWPECNALCTKFTLEFIPGEIQPSHLLKSLANDERFRTSSRDGKLNQQNEYRCLDLKHYLCEVLSVANVLIQIGLTNRFLGGHFFTHGFKALTHLFGDDDQLNNILSFTFPKMSKCIFRKYGPSGTIETIDAYCVLAVNVLNEKMFIFLWVWFIMLAIWSVGDLGFQTYLMFKPNYQPRFLRWLTLRGHPNTEVKDYRSLMGRLAGLMDSFDWLILYEYGQHSGATDEWRSISYVLLLVNALFGQTKDDQVAIH